MMDVGFFLEHHGKNYAPFESQILPETTKKSVSDYMKAGKVIAAAPGIMKDAFTSERIPGEMLVYSDGDFLWTTEAIYYFNKHNLKLPEEFIRKAIN